LIVSLGRDDPTPFPTLLQRSLRSFAVAFFRRRVPSPSRSFAVAFLRRRALPAVAPFRRRALPPLRPSSFLRADPPSPVETD
jgi:hypothetical protein